MVRFLVEALFLFLLWLLLSGKYDLFHVSLGILSASAVAWRCRMFEGIPGPGFWLRFPVYILWLLWRIVLANIHTASLILNPGLPIRPNILLYNTRLRSAQARVLLATSITLTPGTISSDIEGPMITVHALDDKSTEDLISGRLEKMVRWVFGET